MARYSQKTTPLDTLISTTFTSRLAQPRLHRDYGGDDSVTSCPW